MFSFNSTCTTAKLRYGRPEAEGGMWGGGAKQTLGKTDLPIRYQDLVLKRKKARKLIFGRLVWPRFPGNSCSKAAKVRIPSAPSFSSRSCHVGRGKDLRLILVSRKKRVGRTLTHYRKQTGPQRWFNGTTHQSRGPHSGVWTATDWSEPRWGLWRPADGGKKVCQTMREEKKM